MDNKYLDLGEFVMTEAYQKLKMEAQSQNLVLFPYEYGHDAPIYADSGSYLIICPNEKFKRDLRDVKDAFPRLKHEKELNAEEGFNPCYYVIDVSNYYEGTNDISCRMEAEMAIQSAGRVINAFREMGHDAYPDFVAYETVDQLKDFNHKRRDQELPYETRERFEKVFATYAEYAWQKYMEASGRHYRPLITGQRVGKEFFMKNDISAVTDYVNQYFLPYFKEQIPRYPDFYYSLDEDKPAVKMRGLNKLFKGKGKNPFANNHQVTEWKITFPRGKMDSYYKLLTEFNTRMCRQAKSEPWLVGRLPELTTLRLNIRNIQAFDELCGQFGVNYYINHGDMEYMNIKAAMNPLVAFDRKDMDRVRQITSCISKNFVEKNFLTEQEAARAMGRIDVRHEAHRRNNTIVGEPHDERRRSFALSYGYTDLGRE